MGVTSDELLSCYHGNAFPCRLLCGCCSCSNYLYQARVRKMADLSGLIFLLLEMFLEVSASYSVSGLYRGVWYQPIEHHALLGQSFMNISGISAVRCSVRCLSHHGCFSFNYDHIDQVCQMNNASAEHVCDNFQGMPYFSYYDATAKPMPCQVLVKFVHIVRYFLSVYFMPHM